MSMETVKRLATMAGDDVSHTLPSDLEFLARFAALVAAKAGEVMRNQAAGICDRFQARDVGMQPAECAGAIRALAGVTLDDLKGAE